MIQLTEQSSVVQVQEYNAQHLTLPSTNHQYGIDHTNHNNATTTIISTTSAVGHHDESIINDTFVSFHEEFHSDLSKFEQIISQSQEASAKFARKRYIFLSIVAIIVTVTCPNNTGLWNQNKVVVRTALKLFVSYVITLVLMFMVVGSNPGYLNRTIMDCWNNDIETNNNTSVVHNNQNCHTSDQVEVVTYDDLKENVDKTETNKNVNFCNGISLNDEIVEEEKKLINNECVDSDIEQMNVAQSSSSTTRSSTVNGCHRRKYCYRCNISPPLRSHHCKVCKRCVATFDHHCYFIGTCIGEKNHCLFYCFLIAQWIGFCICCSIVNTSNLGILNVIWMNKTKKYSHLDDDNPSLYHNLLIAQVLFTKLYLYPLTVVATMMVIAHTMLILTNTTTFEFSKGGGRGRNKLSRKGHIDYLQDVDVMDLPFSMGPIANVYHFCCVRSRIELFQRQQQFFSWRQSNNDNNNVHETWKPFMWKLPNTDAIITKKYSEDWYNNLWQNKYWSCC